MTNVSYVWALLILLIYPNVSSAITLTWKLALKRFKEWYCPKRLLALELVTSTFSTVGLSLLVFSVLPVLDPLSSILYCNLLVYIPNFLRTVTDYYVFGPSQRLEGQEQGQTQVNDNTDPESTDHTQSGDEPPKETVGCITVVREMLKRFNLYLKSSKVFVAVVASVSVLALILPTVMYGMARKEHHTSHPDNGHIAVYFLIPIFVSSEWIWAFVPDISPDKNNDSHDIEKADEQVPATPDMTNKAYTTIDKLCKSKQELHKGRQSIYLLTNIWKIVVAFIMVLLINGLSCAETFACVGTLFHTHPEANQSSKLNGPVLLVSDLKLEPYIVALITVIANFICFKSCVVAVKVRLQMSFLVPLFLSIIVMPALVIVLYTTETNLTEYGFPIWRGEFEFDYQAGHGLSLFVLSVLVTMLFCISTHQRNLERMLAEHSIFFKTSYYSLLVDQSMLSNRWVRYPNDVSKQSQRSENNDVTTTERKVPMVYLCATMWHEDIKEMRQLLSSIFRLEKDQFIENKYFDDDENAIKFEVNVFFDDAFQYEAGGGAKPNTYVDDFSQALKEASLHIYGTTHGDKVRRIGVFKTPYGQQWHYVMGPSKTKMIVHLKDKRKIRIKKRWSQVMYMYYLLSFKTLESDLDNVYILALDGDVDFQPKALYLLVHRMVTNENVGAACGRIHAIGSGPMVWYQQFEYAVSHWLQKATEHVTGSILCGPGCFTLFRGSALTADNVLRTYTTEPSEAQHYLQYDQGEDRWLCTLLLKQGKKLEYIAASDSYTFAPEGFKAFFKQRRRWVPSTMANIIDLLSDGSTVTRNNASISKLYMAYQLFLFITSILTPGTIFLMMLGATKMAYPSLSLTGILIANLVPVVLFVLVCLYGGDEKQLKVASVLSVCYSIIMIIVLVGLFLQGIDTGACSLTIMFTIFVGGVFVCTALLHPKECGSVIFGMLYFVLTPSMQMLLIIYSITNLNNVSWGTREARGNDTDGVMTKVLGRLRQCCCWRTENDTRAVYRQDEEGQGQQFSELPNTSTDGQVASSGIDVSIATSELDKKETKFWEEFISSYLTPKQADPKREFSDKKKLSNLRNRMTLAFLFLNAIFVTVVFYLQKRNEDTNQSFSVRLPCGTGENIEPIGIAFTAIFGIMLCIQFVCMIIHRWQTFLIIMASTGLRRKEYRGLFKDACDEALVNAGEEEMDEYIEQELLSNRPATRPSSPNGAPATNRRNPESRQSNEHIPLDSVMSFQSENEQLGQLTDTIQEHSRPKTARKLQRPPTASLKLKEKWNEKKVQNYIQKNIRQCKNFPPRKKVTTSTDEPRW